MYVLTIKSNPQSAWRLHSESEVILWLCQEVQCRLPPHRTVGFACATGAAAADGGSVFRVMICCSSTPACACRHSRSGGPAPVPLPPSRARAVSCLSPCVPSLALAPLESPPPPPPTPDDQPVALCTESEQWTSVGSTDTNRVTGSFASGRSIDNDSNLISTITAAIKRATAGEPQMETVSHTVLTSVTQITYHCNSRMLRSARKKNLKATLPQTIYARPGFKNCLLD